MTEPLLSCSGVSVRFGGVQALLDVDFQAGAGSIAAIIGPNGAGKTTLLNVLSGMVPADSGSVRLGGRDLSRARAFERSRAGMVRTFQNLENLLQHERHGERHDRLPRPPGAAGLAQRAAHAPVPGPWSGTSGAMPRRPWISSGSRTRPRPRPATWLSAGSGSWSWPGPWPPGRGSCSWTNRPPG
jgi:ABC-type branched-chain amino acid transport systems, ATPase component